MVELGDFNPDDHEPRSMDALPAGWYAMVITETEKKELNSGTGHRLSVKLQVVEQIMPKIGARVVYHNLNLWNPNSQAVEIAQRELADICRAVGVPSPRDTNELHFKPMAVRLKTRKPDDDYPDGNDVGAFASLEKHFPGHGGGGAAPAGQGGAQAASQPAASKGAGW